VVAVRRKAIAVVNVYAVNGTSKPYYDRTERVAGDRKRRFQSSVMDLGWELRKHGGVVMAGDWNVSRLAVDTFPRLRTEEPHARARAELNARLISDGFVDVWRERHAQERAYTWFNRRARGLDAARFDYILVSQDIVQRVRRSWISCRAAITHRREWNWSFVTKVPSKAVSLRASRRQNQPRALDRVTAVVTRRRCASVPVVACRFQRPRNQRISTV
jgi:hypothetical protein